MCVSVWPQQTWWPQDNSVELCLSFYLYASLMSKLNKLLWCGPLPAGTSHQPSALDFWSSLYVLLINSLVCNWQTFSPSCRLALNCGGYFLGRSILILPNLWHLFQKVLAYVSIFRVAPMLPFSKVLSHIKVSDSTLICVQLHNMDRTDGRHENNAVFLMPFVKAATLFRVCFLTFVEI